MEVATALAGVMVLVGLAGVVVPVLPGLLLTWGGVLVWALARHDGTGWTVLAVATVVAALGMAVKYLVPGRRLREAGVPWTTLAVAGGLAVVGFFVIPVVGAPIGFVLGVFLAELARLGSAGVARESTRHALAAVGWSIAIEFGTALVIAAGWFAVVLLG